MVEVHSTAWTSRQRMVQKMSCILSLPITKTNTTGSTRSQFCERISCTDDMHLDDYEWREIRFML